MQNKNKLSENDIFQLTDWRYDLNVEKNNITLVDYIGGAKEKVVIPANKDLILLMKEEVDIKDVFLTKKAFLSLLNLCKEISFSNNGNIKAKGKSWNCNRKKRKNAVEKVDLTGFDTSQITNMSGLFCYCKNLLEINLAIDTSNVHNMAGLFSSCENLLEINLSVDTSNVTSMAHLFSGCTNISKIHMNINTSNVKNMACMFACCTALQEIDLTLDTSNVEDMREMFYLCGISSPIDLSAWDVSKVRDFSGIFACSNLENINLKNWSVINAVTMDGMFEECYNLRSLDLSSFSNTFRLENVSNMFYSCQNLEYVNMVNIDARNVKEHKDMFKGTRPSLYAVIGPEGKMIMQEYELFQKKMHVVSKAKQPFGKMFVKYKGLNC